MAGRQAEGFVAFAVESDEWQATRRPRSEFEKGWLSPLAHVGWQYLDVKMLIFLVMKEFPLMVSFPMKMCHIIRNILQWYSWSDNEINPCWFLYLTSDCQCISSEVKVFFTSSPDIVYWSILLMSCPSPNPDWWNFSCIIFYLYMRTEFLIPWLHTGK